MMEIFFLMLAKVSSTISLITFSIYQWTANIVKPIPPITAPAVPPIIVPGPGRIADPTNAPVSAKIRTPAALNTVLNTISLNISYVRAYIILAKSTVYLWYSALKHNIYTISAINS